MMEYDWLIGFSAGLLSSLLLLYVGNHVTQRQKTLSFLVTLESELLKIKPRFMSLESSAKQYAQGVKFLEQGKILSIGFPEAKPIEFNLDLAPLYPFKHQALLQKINGLKVKVSCFQDGVQDLHINQIQTRLRSGKSTKKEALQEYKNEIKFVKSIEEEAPVIVGLINEIIAISSLARKDSSGWNGLRIKTQFSSNEIQESIEARGLKERFISIEEYPA